MFWSKSNNGFVFSKYSNKEAQLGLAPALCYPGALDGYGQVNCAGPVLAGSFTKSETCPFGGRLIRPTKLTGLQEEFAHTIIACGRRHILQWSLQDVQASQRCSFHSRLGQSWQWCSFHGSVSNLNQLLHLLRQTWIELFLGCAFVLSIRD